MTINNAGELFRFIQTLGEEVPGWIDIFSGDLRHDRFSPMIELTAILENRSVIRFRARIKDHEEDSIRQLVRRGVERIKEHRRLIHSCPSFGTDVSLSFVNIDAER